MRDVQRILLVVLVAAVSVQIGNAASDFEPYQMNGGLVAAVAGRDWTVLATDTRLTGEGYNILHRNHLSSRLWAATETPESSAISSWISPDGSISLESAATAKSAPATSATAKSAIATNAENEDTTTTTTTTVDASIVSTNLLTRAAASPTFIASAGCQTDCEMLKRLVRADLRTARYFSEGGIGPDQVATLLSQMLYSRRGFPFYSFCIVAGLAAPNDDDNDVDNDDVDDDDDRNENGQQQSESAGGQVFVYDAVGSYEQVAVATSGTGRELLQPILDRQFRTLLSFPAASTSNSNSNSNNNNSSNNESDDTSVANNGLVFRPVPGSVPSTQVDCSKEQAVSILADAYRSVSEREIGVGDQVVFCVLQRKPDGRVESQIIRYPLKKH
jgi:20S proteasome subunit beta 6